MQTLWQERFRQGPPVLLDGATGTELARRGVSVDGPAWSAAALLTHPQIVRQIHEEYAAAGAEIVTANTFRTHARNLGNLGSQRSAQEVAAAAVRLAREATGEQALVAGSLAPLEDCYHPERTPPVRELEREHAAAAEALAAAGADLVLVETQPTIREGFIAAQAASATGLPVLVSFVCAANGRLLSGESLRSAAEAVLPLNPRGILVNCLPVDAVAEAISVLRAACGELAVGAYANAGLRDPDGKWIATSYSAADCYAAAALDWVAQGARIIGGCCGTSPAHIAALRRCLNPSASPEDV
jgi:homocysteine S-methyltransferase